MASTLGDIVFNFKQLTIQIDYEGKVFALQGITPKLKMVKSSSLQKSTRDNVQLFIIRVSSLEEIEEKQLGQKPLEVQQVLQDYEAVFQEPKGLPPFREYFNHHIPLKEGADPINSRPYRYSLVQKDVIEQMVQELKSQGLIQNSCSPFASPVVLVGKKNGNLRLCVDYRALNQITIKDKCPITIIEELLDELGGS